MLKDREKRLEYFREYNKKRRDTQEHKDYMNQYMLNRRTVLLNKAKEQLGGKCVQCGSVEQLEFDHIDPSTKIFCVAWKTISVSYEALKLEVAKCQLLCGVCHLAKTHKDLGRIPSKGIHGTQSMYNHMGCRCDDCKKAESARQKVKNNKVNT